MSPHVQEKPLPSLRWTGVITQARAWPACRFLDCEDVNQGTAEAGRDALFLFSPKTAHTADGDGPIGQKFLLIVCGCLIQHTAGHGRLDRCKGKAGDKRNRRRRLGLPCVLVVACVLVQSVTVLVSLRWCETRSVNMRRLRHEREGGKGGSRARHTEGNPHCAAPSQSFLLPSSVGGLGGASVRVYGAKRNVVAVKALRHATISSEPRSGTLRSE